MRCSLISRQSFGVGGLPQFNQLAHIAVRGCSAKRGIIPELSRKIYRFILVRDCVGSVSKTENRLPGKSIRFNSFWVLSTSPRKRSEECGLKSLIGRSLGVEVAKETSR